MVVVLVVVAGSGVSVVVDGGDADGCFIHRAASAWYRC